jgi:4-phospho-D-threonate 3-dehydrogenase / 4-phospho-D-erythronate 3-dehydrogenase
LNMDQRPIIGVTTGDPAGVGPEIVARAVGNADLHQAARLLVFGTASVLSEAIALVGAGLSVHRVRDPQECIFSAGTMDLVDLATEEVEGLKPGVVQGRAGQAAFHYIRSAIEMAMDGRIDAIATAPINKEALRAGAVPYLDHTAMLAALTASIDPMTLFVLDNLRIFFLTRHVPLAEACRMITTASVVSALQRSDAELRKLGMERPRIAVAGLNPHAGDGGLFGSEDDEQIAPAVAHARALGIDASGPIPADSVFYQNRLGRYDAVLALYHDQGHIAAKTVDFERTISLTVGLPFLRTSVDHGTAFDIAGKGTASATGMEEAITVAAQYAPLFRRA